MQSTNHKIKQININSLLPVGGELENNTHSLWTNEATTDTHKKSKPSIHRAATRLCKSRLVAYCCSLNQPSWPLLKQRAQCARTELFSCSPFPRMWCVVVSPPPARFQGSRTTALPTDRSLQTSGSTISKYLFFRA